MTRKTFEEIGREADLATRHHTAAVQWVERVRQSAAPGNFVKIVLTGANWSDGSAAMQEHLNRSLMENLGDILGSALDAMHDQAEEALAVAREAFNGNAPLPETHQVPRGVSEPETPLQPGDDDGRGTILSADALKALRADFDKLPQAAKELLAWIKANPGQNFAKSSAATALKSAGFYTFEEGQPVITEAGEAVLRPAPPILP